MLFLEDFAHTPKARVESLPCTADFFAMHFKFQLQVPAKKFCETTKGIIGLLFSDTDTSLSVI